MTDTFDPLMEEPDFGPKSPLERRETPMTHADLEIEEMEREFEREPGFTWQERQDGV